MTQGIVGLVIGLLLGAYLATSYPDTIMSNIEKTGVPLLGHSSSAMPAKAAPAAGPTH